MPSSEPLDRAALGERLDAIFSFDVSSGRNYDELIEPLLDVERATQDFALHWAKVAARTHLEIAYLVVLLVPQALRRLSPRQAEAWVVAAELAAAKAPVVLDALVNLPGSFDDLGARLDNAARLQRAGVVVVFSQAGLAPHNARKVRQLAGNAVAHGMPWDAALAGLTANPAQVFGLGASRGRIEAGRAADLVLWDGDPLEVTSAADQVWIGGKAVSMRSRQTELLERYLPQAAAQP